MLEKKILQAELVLEKLISAGVKSSQVIRCALRYYTQLYVAHGLLCNGMPFSQAFSQLKPRIFFKYTSAFNAALKEYSVHQVLCVIEQLLALEIRAKAVDAQSAWVICHKKLYEILSRQV
jgi:DNA polymerase III delta subunit